jgi:hypothetical protein
MAGDGAPWQVQWGSSSKRGEWGRRGAGGADAGGTRGEGGLLGEGVPWGCRRSSILRSLFCSVLALYVRKKRRRERKGKKKGKGKIPNLEIF